MSTYTKILGNIFSTDIYVVFCSCSNFSSLQIIWLSMNWLSLPIKLQFHCMFFHRSNCWNQPTRTRAWRPTQARRTRLDGETGGRHMRHREMDWTEYIMDWKLPCQEWIILEVESGLEWIMLEIISGLDFRRSDHFFRRTRNSIWWVVYPVWRHWTQYLFRLITNASSYLLYWGDILFDSKLAFNKETLGWDLEWLCIPLSKSWNRNCTSDIWTMEQWGVILKWRWKIWHQLLNIAKKWVLKSIRPNVNSTFVVRKIPK